MLFLNSNLGKCFSTTVFRAILLYLFVKKNTQLCSTIQSSTSRLELLVWLWLFLMKGFDYTETVHCLGKVWCAYPYGYLDGNKHLHLHCSVACQHHYDPSTLSDRLQETKHWGRNLDNLDSLILNPRKRPLIGWCFEGLPYAGVTESFNCFTCLGVISFKMEWNAEVRYKRHIPVSKQSLSSEV